MASPDRIKIGAYLTESENEALKRVADSLGVSASKAVAMAIKALDEKIQKGNKVSLPVAVSTIEKVEPSPDIQSLVNESVKSAIAALKNELLDDLKKDEPIE
jgi:ribosomal protein L18E